MVHKAAESSGRPVSPSTDIGCEMVVVLKSLWWFLGKMTLARRPSLSGGYRTRGRNLLDCTSPHYYYVPRNWIGRVSNGWLWWEIYTLSSCHSTVWNESPACAARDKRIKALWTIVDECTACHACTERMKCLTGHVTHTFPLFVSDVFQLICMLARRGWIAWEIYWARGWLLGSV